MDYNKNKYNLIKQIGGGIEEYREKDRPVLQSIFTNIAHFSTSQIGSNTTKRDTLTKLIRDKVSDCIVIQVRGNGLCLLNAVCTVFFIMQRVKNISSLLTEELPVSVHNVNEGIPYRNQLNISISEYIMIIYRRVAAELTPMSYKIVDLIIRKMKHDDSKATYDIGAIYNSEDIYNSYHYRRDMNAENYDFFQLGQILSTLLDCVIILVGVTGDLSGVFPLGDTLSVSLQDISVQQITNNINKRVWGVIFIVDVTERHFHSLIPLAGPDITESNIQKYNKVRGSIAWN